MAKRDEELFRIAEDHILLGLEGRTCLGKQITYENLCLYELIREPLFEYPVYLKVEGPGIHTGDYRFESRNDMIEIIQKIIGGVDVNISSYVNNKLDTFAISSHKGHFVFHVSEKEKPL